MIPSLWHRRAEVLGNDVTNVCRHRVSTATMNDNYLVEILFSEYISKSKDRNSTSA
jgi:hypothetical protein